MASLGHNELTLLLWHQPCLCGTWLVSIYYMAIIMVYRCGLLWSSLLMLLTQQIEWTLGGLPGKYSPANERQCYFVMTSLIGWAQALNQPLRRLVFWHNVNPKRIWLLCLVPTSTTRFASDLGYKMAKNFEKVIQGNTFYEQWHQIP